jgi:altronate hydrolase
MSLLNSLTIRLNHSDNVVIAIAALEPQKSIPGENISCQDRIPEGHKVATETIAKGETILKYGQIIGVASRDIKPGEHVHTQNMEMVNYERKYTFGTKASPTVPVSEKEQAFFQGIVRADGRVATRNYIGVIASAQCSSSVARFIAEAFDKNTLAAFPNVDGVVSIVHGSGCGLADHGEGIEYLQRTLGGWAHHPNFAGVFIVGLGCEINQIDVLTDKMNLEPSSTFRTLNIQSVGGTNKAVQLGIEAVKEMLPDANNAERRAVPASHLVVGLECGGSDALSGITANPALGVASDLVVRHGGTVILSETTEIYGAEQLLVQRAEREEVGQKLVDRIHWWEEYTQRNGIELNNNPSPGNKAGGLTTILEKSLGAVAKSGSTNLVEVYRYAEPVTSKGLVFMDTPGYDMVSVTGKVAGGANIICFTTGRGSVYGNKPVPTIKLASNTKMYRAMEEDMDINCGLIVDGEASLDETGHIIFQRILDTASGKKTKNELLGFGDNEFAPWHVGATL